MIKKCLLFKNNILIYSINKKIIYRLICGGLNKIIYYFFLLNF